MALPITNTGHDPRVKERIPIEQMVEIPIKTTEALQTWQIPVTWQDLINTPNMQPDDVICDIYSRDVRRTGFGADEDDPTTAVPFIRVKRTHMETNDEYYTRQQQVEKTAQSFRDKEYTEYLRLKAKFDKV